MMLNKLITMRNLFVPFETALKLKEKGFDVQCFAFYNSSGELLQKTAKGFNSGLLAFDLALENTLAPLYRQVIDWLREEKGIWISIDWHKETNTFRVNYKREWYSSYYSALQSGIEKALEII